MSEFIVTDPSGKEFVVNAPEGATQEQALEFAKSQFGATPGGAAVGNPSIQAQGDRAARSQNRLGENLGIIGGAAALGGAAGAYGAEIASGLGRVVSAVPLPGARVVGAAMERAAPALRAAGRGVGALSGAQAGAYGETAGQVAEAAGAGPVGSEVARFVGGGLGPEALTAAKSLLQTYVTKPALSFAMHLKKQAAKEILGHLDEGKPLSQQQQEYLDGLLAELRGGAKTDAPLEGVGSIMGAEGDRLMSAGERGMTNALRQQGSVGRPTGYPGGSRDMADIGGGLRETITKRNEVALKARSRQYKANEEARDTIVRQQEDAGRYVTALPEHQALVQYLEDQLVPGRHSPEVARGFQQVLNGITVKGADDEAITILGAEGQALSRVPTGAGNPVTFQAIDDVRRKLGDAFRGKPAEGYEAIGDAAAKQLYAKVSEIQKRFAGTPQAKLLDDYAEATEGLQVFSSRQGKKVTALDQYRDEQFATDATTLPATFFKTRASIRALKELTGSEAQVRAAALEYADHQLTGKTAAEARSWMGKNAEWLSETGATRALVDKYVTRLEGAERAMRNAQDFAKRAASDSNLLVGKGFPADRAVDLIRSGNAELWEKITPAIVKSPQAKAQMVAAVRQVIADQATAKTTADLFARSIRPALEKSGIASTAEMDSITRSLASIQEMKVPEPEKLGWVRRAILQGSAGWAATAVSRTGEQSMEWAIPQ